MNTSELTAFIKTKALELGFAGVGIARAEPIRTRPALERWLSRGYHGEMAWMEKNLDKRSDPRVLYPPAKSIVCVSMNYYTPHPIVSDAQKGKISRYAWGDDYHDVLHERLKLLLQSIRETDASVDGKICVDTAPMMDKYWAAEAGIGWQGKNSNIITREIGSWVFLGELIVNVELNYDRPIGDFCGTCNRCIEACPTGAITEPYVVDSTKCISYYTIEYRGESFPKSVADNLNNWIYGCDICQDVCPWNEKFAEPTSESAFEPRAQNLNPELEIVKNLSEEQYKQVFKKSPMKRAKLKGLTRNVKEINGKSNK